MNTGDRLWKRLEYIAKIDGVKLQTKKEAGRWLAGVRKDNEEYDGKPENMIYYAKLEPTSEECKRRYGKLTLEMEEKVMNGEHDFAIQYYYHGTRLPIKMDFAEMDRFRGFCDVRLDDPCADQFLGKFPILDLDDEYLQGLMEKGTLKIEEEERNGKKRKWAAIELPDEVFKSASHMGYVRYISLTSASLIKGFVAAPYGMFSETMYDILGEKEFIQADVHMKMLSGNLVRTMALMRRSNGLAMVDHYLLLPEERAAIDLLFDEYQVDVAPKFRTWFLTPISNVLKKNMSDSNESSRHNARKLAYGLNEFPTMRASMEKLRETADDPEMPDFNQHQIIGMVNTAIDRNNERKALKEAFERARADNFSEEE